MSLKEANRVRMTGVLPSQGAGPIPVGKIPDGATQILKGADATNAVVTIHTVTAGKTLCLSACSAGCYAISTGIVHFWVRDSGGVEIASFIAMQAFASTPLPPYSGYFIPPIEIPAGYNICVSSSAAGLSVRGMIHGYEI